MVLLRRGRGREEDEWVRDGVSRKQMKKKGLKGGKGKGEEPVNSHFSLRQSGLHDRRPLTLRSIDELL